jgi:hypothetical protein
LQRQLGAASVPGRPTQRVVLAKRPRVDGGERLLLLTKVGQRRTDLFAVGVHEPSAKFPGLIVVWARRRGRLIGFPGDLFAPQIHNTFRTARFDRNLVSRQQLFQFAAFERLARHGADH